MSETPQKQEAKGTFPSVEHQFKPGQSGNPGGRPKGSSVTTPFLRKLAANPNEYGEGEEAERLAQRWLDALMGHLPSEDVPGFLKALSIALDRADGTVVKQERREVQELKVRLEGVEGDD